LGVAEVLAAERYEAFGKLCEVHGPASLGAAMTRAARGQFLAMNPRRHSEEDARDSVAATG